MRTGYLLAAFIMAAPAELYTFLSREEVARRLSGPGPRVLPVDYAVRSLQEACVGGAAQAPLRAKIAATQATEASGSKNCLVKQ